MNSKYKNLELNDDGSINQKNVGKLPFLFQEIEKLHTVRYREIKYNDEFSPDILSMQNSVPLSIWEFEEAYDRLPIVFSLGEFPEPLALMGLTKNINVFIDDSGFIDDAVYIPKYARLYPFIGLPDAEDRYEGTVCFDPSCPAIGETVDGVPLYEDGEPTVYHDVIMERCREVQENTIITENFVALLQKHELLRV
jgi:hypothetical protein